MKKCIVVNAIVIAVLIITIIVVWIVTGIHRQVPAPAPVNPVSNVLGEIIDIPGKIVKGVLKI